MSVDFHVDGNLGIHFHIHFRRTFKVLPVSDRYECRISLLSYRGRRVPPGPGAGETRCNRVFGAGDP